MDDLCRGGCYLEMTRRRSSDEERHWARTRRYRSILKNRQANGETCIYCSTRVEVLHHKDEDQSNNRPINLLSMCKIHHLEQEHKSDSEVEFEHEASIIPLSGMSWTSAKNSRSLTQTHLEAPSVPTDNCPTRSWPISPRRVGQLGFFWKTK